MKKFIVSSVFLLIIALSGVFAGSSLLSSAPSVREAQAIAPAYPAVLSIPKLGTRTTFETVGKDSSGRMAAPTNEDKVAWYGLGVKPGEVGKAVVAGHVNTKDLEPGIFADIDSLQVGDTISILDTKDKIWQFEVRSVNEFADSNFPIEDVFGSSNSRSLYLITCAGSYDEKRANFTHRVVVEAVLKTV